MRPHHVHSYKWSYLRLPMLSHDSICGIGSEQPYVEVEGDHLFPIVFWIPILNQLYFGSCLLPSLFLYLLLQPRPPQLHLWVVPAATALDAASSISHIHSDSGRHDRNTSSAKLNCHSYYTPINFIVRWSDGPMIHFIIRVPQWWSKCIFFSSFGPSMIREAVSDSLELSTTYPWRWKFVWFNWLDCFSIDVVVKDI